MFGAGEANLPPRKLAVEPLKRKREDYQRRQSKNHTAHHRNGENEHQYPQSQEVGKR